MSRIRTTKQAAELRAVVSLRKLDTLLRRVDALPRPPRPPLWVTTFSNTMLCTCSECTHWRSNGNTIMIDRVGGPRGSDGVRGPDALHPSDLFNVRTPERPATTESSDR